MPPVGKSWDERQMNALTDYLQRRSSLAANAETPTPAWQRGRVASWLVTADHKRIGILYLVTSGFFFLAGGVMALLIRTQLAQADNDFLERDSYNQLFTMHGTTMVFLVVVPILAGFGNYLVPLMIGARDMAFPRLNALSYWLFLFGGIVLLLSFFAAGRRRQVGLDGLPAALRPGDRQRPGPLDPRAAHAHALVARGRDQLHRHDPQHAGPRDDLDAHAALRLGDRAPTRRC